MDSQVKCNGHRQLLADSGQLAHWHQGPQRPRSEQHGCRNILNMGVTIQLSHAKVRQLTPPPSLPKLLETRRLLKSIPLTVNSLNKIKAL